MGTPLSSDVARDALSAFLGGVLLMAVGGLVTLYRHFRNRLGRHGIEIRHTQKETKVEPFFPEYPGDKL